MHLRFRAQVDGLYARGQWMFSIMGQIVNIFGLEDHTVSVVATA